MHTRTLLRPLVFIAAGLSVAGSALADTFGNFTYTSDGTSVTITNYANVAVDSIVIPAEIDGVPVRTISRMSNPLGGVLRSSLQSITIPEGVTTIGPNAFKEFTALQSVTLPNSVTSVGDFAFYNCTGVTSANVGNGLTELRNIFVGCTNLTTVDLPDQLVSLYYTFGKCPNLTAIQLPASVTSLEGAFMDCTNLASVVLPAGLTALGTEAFSGCTGLQNVTFPNGLLSIGDRAFNTCTGLTSLTFPASLKTIGDDAFGNCPGLTSLSFPPALTTIGNGAFQACTGLTGLVVPDAVTTIGDDAFWACSNLTSVDLPPRFLASISNIGLDYRPELASDALENGIADRLANNPAFISKLADTIIAKNDHYGLATQANITTVVNETPQAVRDVLAEISVEAPAVNGITSDLGGLSVKKGKPLAYTITTSFGATAYFAFGLPDGVVIDSATGAISGKAKKAGTYNVLLQAGNPGGGTVGAVKTITVTP
jgi:hypothetical protein